MREPQVDTFCRCVKKVKKTLKARPGSTKDRSAAEGRAIAICTKSVLQTKGRTIRKVRCRDKVLETQPMKPQEGGDDQTGGKFKWAGADTPVFNKESDGIADWNGFPIMLLPTEEELKKLPPKMKEKASQSATLRKPWLDGLITKYDPVVRMVSSGDGEIAMHRTLKDMIKYKSDPFNDPFVTMHMNLWARDGIYRVNYAATEAMVRKQTGTDKDEKLRKLRHIKDKFGNFKWYGLVTRTQEKDIENMEVEQQIAPLCDILRTLLHINGRVVHFDLHYGNMAVMRDGTAVIHDVGRMKLRDFDLKEAPWELVRPIKSNKRILRNVLANMFEWPNEFMDYRQHFYIGRTFMNLRKDGELFGFVKEPYKKPTEEGGWIQEPVNANLPANQLLFQKNLERFEVWLDEFNPGVTTAATPKKTVWVKRYIAAPGIAHYLNKMYDISGNVIPINRMNDIDPTAPPDDVYFDHPFETRYYQIARIFDILSVLAALSHTGGTGRVAWYYARKAAVKLIKLLNERPYPNATKENVEKVVREFLSYTGTIREMKNDAGSETEAAKIYWSEVNDPRSGKNVPVPVADPAPAAAPAPADDPDAIEKAKAERLEAMMEDARLAQGSSPMEELEAGINRLAESEAKRKTAGKDGSVQVEDKNIGAVIMSPTDILDEAGRPDLPQPETQPPRPPGINYPPLENPLEKETEPAAATAPPEAPPPTDGRQEGGAAGGSAIALPIGPGWTGIPAKDGGVPPVDAIAAAVAEGGAPETTMLYISSADNIERNQTLVKNSPYGKALKAITYYSVYTASPASIDLAGTKAVWYVDESSPSLRLSRVPWKPDLESQEATVLNRIKARGVRQCFLMPKFEKTVDEADPVTGISAMFNVLDGLCMERDFVINDLHLGNMAIKGGTGYTFDFDLLITKGAKGDPDKFKEFMEYLRRVHHYSDYAGLLQHSPASPLYFELRILIALKTAAEDAAAAAAAVPAKGTRAVLNAAATAKEAELRRLAENKVRSEVAARFDVRPGEFTTGEQRSEQLLAAVENVNEAKLVDASIAGIAEGTPPGDAAVLLQKAFMTRINRFFCIYDILSVLSSLKALCYAAGNGGLFKLVEVCERQLKINGELEAERCKAIGLLKTGFETQRALHKATWRSTMGEAQTIWGIIQAAKERPSRPGYMPKPKRPGLNLPGGRRTFRRKGLPQLL